MSRENRYSEITSGNFQESEKINIKTTVETLIAYGLYGV